MKAKGAKCEFFSFFKPILFGHGVNSKLSSQLVQFHAPCLIYNNVFDHIFFPTVFLSSGCLWNFQDFPTPNVFYLNANVTHCNFIHIDFLTVAYISQSICSMREIIKRSLRKVYTTYIARLALSQERYLDI